MNKNKLYEYRVFGDLIEIPELTNILKGHRYHVYKNKYNGEIEHVPSEDTYAFGGGVMSVCYAPNLDAIVVNVANGQNYSQIDLLDFMYNYIDEDDIDSEDYDTLVHYAENPDEYKYDFDIAESNSDPKKDRATLKRLVESYGKEDVLKYIKSIKL